MSDEDQRGVVPDDNAAAERAASATADAFGLPASVPTPRTTTARGELVGPLGVAAAVLVIDQITKSWVQDRLADGHTVHLVGSLRLNLTYNSGMAFSRGSGLGPVIGVLALVLVVVMLASLRREGSPMGRLALGLVIGGAAGNIVDRLFRGGGGFLRGKVIDFVDAQFWPVFNVADIAVSVGGALLVIGALVAGRRHRASAAADPGPS
jgi:signal peptidase II